MNDSEILKTSPNCTSPCETKPLKRKYSGRVSRACQTCKKGKRCCDEARPCSRCIRLGIGDTCIDAERKRPKNQYSEKLASIPGASVVTLTSRSPPSNNQKAKAKSPFFAPNFPLIVDNSARISSSITNEDSMKQEWKGLQELRDVCTSCSDTILRPDISLPFLEPLKWDPKKSAATTQSIPSLSLAPIHFITKEDNQNLNNKNEHNQENPPTKDPLWKLLSVSGCKSSCKSDITFLSNTDTRKSTNSST